MLLGDELMQSSTVCDEKFSQIEGFGRKISHIELSTSVISNIFYQCTLLNLNHESGDVHLYSTTNLLFYEISWTIIVACLAEALEGSIHEKKNSQKSCDTASLKFIIENRVGCVHGAGTWTQPPEVAPCFFNKYKILWNEVL